MAWSLVAKVVHMVVDRVVKLWSLIGLWCFMVEKEEEENGMEVLLLLEMEEEMEEKEVEEFVVEKMDLVGGGNGRPRELRGLCLLLELAGNKEDEGE